MSEDEDTIDTLMADVGHLEDEVAQLKAKIERMEVSKDRTHSYMMDVCQESEGFEVDDWPDGMTFDQALEFIIEDLRGHREA